jgi:NAD(P)-dependent dehydrogenase (short-subunit alcohol dehydrogenase family)
VVSRCVLVTGGLGGIGLATARAFAPEGTRILLVDAREDDGAACASLRRAGAADAFSFAADVSDERSVANSVDALIERWGAIDVVVNVAGTMIYKPIAALGASDWRRMLDINFVGAALYTGHALRRMRPGGCVVNVASVHARRTTPLVAPYAAAKAALVSLTRSAAIEGRPLGIRVNAVLPGAIDTPMLRESPAIKSGAEVLDENDIGQPEDIAATVVFLASEGARFITGEDVVADAGRMGRL